MAATTNGGNTYSLKEMLSALLEKVDRIDVKLDQLRDSKADKDEVRQLTEKVHKIELDLTAERAVKSYKKYWIPIITSICVSALSIMTYLYIAGKL